MRFNELFNIQLLKTPLIKPETLTNNHEAVKPAKPAELNTVKHN